MMTGRLVSTMSAQTRFQSLKYIPKKLYTARVMGHLSVLPRKYSGITNSLQVFRKVSTITVTSTGFISGITIRKKRERGDAPSMTAASSISGEILLTKLWIRKTLKGIWVAV